MLASNVCHASFPVMKLTGQLGAQKKYGQLNVNSSFQTCPKRHCVGHSGIMENSTKVFFLPSLTSANLSHTSAWLPKIVVTIYHLAQQVMLCGYVKTPWY